MQLGGIFRQHVLAMCHEACEESLAASSINLKGIFSNPVAVTIVHASVDFLRLCFAATSYLLT